MNIQPRTLQQRTALFILLPTFLLLLALFMAGFISARDILLDQWGEAAVARLQQSANLIDSRLREPKKLLLLLQGEEDGTVNKKLVTHIVSRVEELDGVVGVNIEWPGRAAKQSEPAGAAPVDSPANSSPFHMQRFEISSPEHNRKTDNRTVSLVSEFKTKNNTTVGQVEVLISFESLIEQVVNTPWWKTNKVYLLDGDNNVLASTGLELGLEDSFPMRSFGTMSVLEHDTLQALQNSSSGTVFGPEKPPDEISGFYHLGEAPWTMVIIAPGKKILHPVIQFRRFSFISFAVSLLLVLLFMRGAMNQVTKGIKQLSVAADNLARGQFGPPLEVSTRDEVGELTANFNKMTSQLKQRLELKQAIDLAREVQQNLIPAEGFSSDDVEISGRILYCDETGGDYFDILRFPESAGKVGVVVGDVVGHGIGAALLMTTVRALLRCRIVQPASLGKVMNDVNSLLCQDTENSGSFVTLFYLEYDQPRNLLNWVRAGHDPALVYSPGSGTFSELKGRGIALGVDPEWSFDSNEKQPEKETQFILIGSDGVWEVKNDRGEQFGKERVKEVLAANSMLEPEAIIEALLGEITGFRGETPQDDDITLVILKLF